MLELTGRQRRFLRGLGQGLQVVCVVGKAGVTEGFIDNVSRLLAAHELIKIRLAGGSGSDRKAVAARIADAVGAACVGLTGRVALLYRPRERTDARAPIRLP